MEVPVSDELIFPEGISVESLKQIFETGTAMTVTSSVLSGTRIVSLALNLPGPAALMRCRRMAPPASSWNLRPATRWAGTTPRPMHNCTKASR